MSNRTVLTDERLNQIRTAYEHNIPAKELAKEIGISYGTVSSIYRGFKINNAPRKTARDILGDTLCPA